MADDSRTAQHLLRQVGLIPTAQDHALITTSSFADTNGEGSTEISADEQINLRASLQSDCPGSVWPPGSFDSACPRPIVVGKHHEESVKELSKALIIAITDIIERWFDDESQYWKRMPLEDSEEGLLRVSRVMPLSERTATSVALRCTSLANATRGVDRWTGSTG